MEGGAGAGPPPLDSEAAPGSVVPLPQMWAPLFAEPQPVPMGKEREAETTQSHPWETWPYSRFQSQLTSPGLRHRRVLLAELPLISRRTCSCVSSWTTRRPKHKTVAFSSHLQASGPGLPFA